MIFKKKISVAMAFVLALVLACSALTSLKVSAASDKSVTVKTVKGIAKMAKKGYTTITLKYKKSGKITVPKGDYSDVTIVFKASKAKVTNKASFKTVKLAAAKTFTQAGSVSEDFIITDSSLTFKLAKGCELKTLTINKDSAKIKLNIVGTLETVVLEKKAKIDVNNNSSEPVMISDGSEDGVFVDPGESVDYVPEIPDNKPTDAPTGTPTEIPADTPVVSPTDTPDPTSGILTPIPVNPTDTPTVTPTVTPTESPDPTPFIVTPIPVDPTTTPTGAPTETPTEIPTEAPTGTPTDAPTQTPTDAPTGTPTETPTDAPTAAPTAAPPAIPISVPMSLPLGPPERPPMAEPIIEPKLPPV